MLRAQASPAASRRLIGLPLLLTLSLFLVFGNAPVVRAASSPSLGYVRDLSTSGTVKCTAGGEFTQPFSAPAVGDLFGDGRKEIVAAFSDGYVYAWFAATGQVVAGWPKQVADGVAGSPTIAVLDGDTLPSIVVADYSGTVNVWNGYGDERPGWPQHSLAFTGLDPGFFSSVAVGDIFGDGRQELFASALDHHTFAWFSNGTAVPGWPKQLADTSLSTPTIANLQHNGTLDVVTPSDASGEFGVHGGLYWAWSSSGQQLWWTGVNEVPWSSSAAVDFGDGDTVIVNGTGHYYSQVTGQPVGRYIEGLNQNGTNRSGYPVATNDVSFASPAVGDLEGNGGREVVEVTEHGTMYAVNGSGSLLSGFPLTLPGAQPFSAGPAIAPVDASGRNGIFVPSFDGLLVYSMANLGSPTIAGLPAGFSSYSTPTIADLGNGSLSVLLSSAAGSFGCGGQDTYLIRVWNINGTTPSMLNASAWPTFHGNMSRSGDNINLPLPPRNVVATATGSSQATLTWSPPSDATFDQVTGYRVTVYNDQGQAVGSPQVVSGASTVVGGLQNGTPWYFGVTALNQWGASREVQSNSVTPLSGIAPGGGNAARSTLQYLLPNSDGTTWQVMDESRLAFTVTPASNETVLLGANSDLWTFTSGYNQDLGIQVTPGGGVPSLVAWKEAGGFGGTFSPNAAYVQAVYAMSGGVTYTVQVVWKTNRPAIGAVVAAGAGAGVPFSPTTLTADVLPSGYQSSVSLKQYSLAGSDGTTWAAMDPSRLVTASLAPTTDASVVLSGNADLWTANAGYNQDLGIFVSEDGKAPTLVAWKESGGFAGTFSPNAAFVQTVYPMQAGHTYVFSLWWKANRPASGATIFAGAGPISGNFSPTRITAYTLPADSGSSAWGWTTSTQQYQLSDSDGATWGVMDATKLTLGVGVPSGDAAETVLVSGNADLWTADSGYNQDLGLFVSEDGGASTMVAWKESGGFAGTFSPNAAFVQWIYTLQPGHAYVFTLEWKTNKPASGATIFAGAGPIGTAYSNTSLGALPQA